MLTKVGSQKLEVGSEKKKFKTVLFGICFLFFGISSYAQCAMCRAALGGDANMEKAQAVNDGIVYLMIIPYLLVAVIGFLIYRMRKNKQKN